LNIGVCADKRIGYELLRFIFETDKTPIKFVLTKESSSHKDKIEQLCRNHGIKCYTNVDCNSKKFQSILIEEQIDIGLLIWWPTIVKKHIIQTVKVGFINTHPSYLPYNRGKHPYYWSVIDGTPAGSTLHFIDENIDEGYNLFQERYEVDITETGDKIYEKSLKHMEMLFKKSYNNIVMSNYVPKKQNLEIGQFHLAKDIEQHSKIDLEAKYKGLDLINIIRARTFKNNKSAYFLHNNKKYFVRIEIEEDKGQYN
tara:strand:+ start:115 stop:879 length:765 start_codon:yes stop_codon:yes gene_type:complete